MKKIQAIQPDLLEKGFPRSYHNWVERKETALKDSKAYWKLTHYLEDGFYPCDTLIMTYESDQKRLTPEEIELAIDRYLYSWKYEKVI
ncbi:MAG: hypothetical protein IJH77_03550 [Mogibacterium sp.]|nr:hypothetical protein [Mogibacterium sp.]